MIYVSINGIYYKNIPALPDSFIYWMLFLQSTVILKLFKKIVNGTNIFVIFYCIIIIWLSLIMADDCKSCNKM